MHESRVHSLSVASCVALVVLVTGGLSACAPSLEEVDAGDEAELRGLTVSANANPNTLAAGERTTISSTVQLRTSRSLRVRVEVVHSSGQRVFEQSFDNQFFEAGQARQYTTTWQVPASQAAGSYDVAVTLFLSGSNRRYAQRNSLARITVTSGAPVCAPTTCVSQGKNCGSIPDGCGGTLSCGTCVAPQTCGGGGVPNVCGAAATCTRTTCSAQGKNCGSIPDGCGGTLACGSCVTPQTCGGGGVANVCGGGGSAAKFSEDFANPLAFAQRFDFGISGGVTGRNDWPGDHDMACGEPNGTRRTIHVNSPSDTSQVFYLCLPGGDASKGHLMTSINTEGYTIAWFSPKQVFSNVRRVCYDQNMTDLRGGKWTQVIFPTLAEIGGSSDLGFTSPEFPQGVNGPTTPRGSVSHGFKIHGGSTSFWSSLGEWNQFEPDSIQRVFSWGDSGFNQTTSDKAPRFQQCIVDNENGTITLTRKEPDGSTRSSTVSGEIPNGEIRVVFEDDNYNPDKHQEPVVEPNASNGYTWHWDNILIE